MFFTPAQEWAIVIVPKVTSLICILGSLFMIIDVLRNGKKLGSSYHRIILGMSICLLLSSVAIFGFRWNLSWWSTFGTDKNGPINKPLCKTERFFFVFGISVVMYNVALSIYYFLVVKYNWSKARIRKIEPWLHIFSVGWGLMTATVVVIVGNVSGEFDKGLCIYLNRVCLYVFLVPIWIAMIAVTVMNLVVYRTVRNQEERSERYRFSSGDGSSRKLSGQAAKQGVLYVVPFYIAWIPYTICIVYLDYLYDLNPTSDNFFTAVLISRIFGPLQGILNCFVYIAPRYRKYREDRPESSFLQVIGWTLHGMLCFRNTNQNNDNQLSSPSGDKREHGLHSEDGSRRILTSAENNTEPLLGPDND